MVAGHWGAFLNSPERFENGYQTTTNKDHLLKQNLFR